MPIKLLFITFSMLLSMLLSQNSIAQNTNYDELGSWNIINLKVNLHPKWSFFAETQLRSLSFYHQFHYYEAKTGITYNLNKYFSLASGIGHYVTFSEGGNFQVPKKNDEIRAWLQINMHQYLEFLKFEHRYRIEQRWTLNGFRNRFRYRINIIIPLNTKKVETKTIYVTTWNELFLTNQAPFFERNRFFIGLGYEFTNNFTVQSGWVNQLDYKINDESGLNFFQISLLFELNRKKHKDEEIPVSE